jgi:CheY-like chemotaxis protein
MRDTSLSGRRVLVVEDEMLVSMLLEDMLGDLGCEVLGPATKIDDALALAEGEDIDFAILDVNLNGTESYPVADALAARGVPFMFATGYGGEGLRESYRHVPVMPKPFQQRDVEKLLSEALSGVRLPGRA